MAEAKLSNTLVNDDSTGTIAYSNQIKDQSVNKFQSEINSDILADIAELREDIESGGTGGGTITVDQSLSTTSTNAVSNKAVTVALNSKLSSIPDATDASYGAVKLGKSGVVTGNKVYPVQLYSNNTVAGENPGGMAVYVPWENTSYTLPTATSSTLGGVKVGAGLAINNGVLSATGGGTADSVDWSNITNIPYADSSNAGVVTLGSSSTISGEKSYLVGKNAAGKLAVNVPWTDTVTTSIAWGNITGKPNIPTKTSQLTNDSNFINSSTADTRINTYYNNNIKGRIDSVEERIATLELGGSGGGESIDPSAVTNIINSAKTELRGEFNTADTALSNRIDGVNQSVSSHSNRIEDLETTVDTLQSTNTSLQNSINTHTTNISSLQTTTNSLNTTLSNLSTVVGNANSGLVKKVNDHVSSINHNRIEDIESSVNTLETNVSTLFTDVNTNTSDLSRHNTKITELEDQVSTLNSNDEGFRTLVGNHDTEITALKAKDTSLTNSINSLTNTIGDSTKGLTKTINTHAASIDDLYSHANTATENISALQTELEEQLGENHPGNLRERIGEVETIVGKTVNLGLRKSVANLNTSVSTLNTFKTEAENYMSEFPNERLQDMEDNITALQTDASTLNTELNATNGSITNLGGRIDDLERWKNGSSGTDRNITLIDKETAEGLNYKVYLNTNKKVETRWDSDGMRVWHHEGNLFSGKDDYISLDIAKFGSNYAIVKSTVTGYSKLGSALEYDNTFPVSYIIEANEFIGPTCSRGDSFYGEILLKFTNDNGTTLVNYSEYKNSAYDVLDTTKLPIMSSNNCTIRDIRFAESGGNLYLRFYADVPIKKEPNDYRIYCTLFYKGRVKSTDVSVNSNGRMAINYNRNHFLADASWSTTTLIKCSGTHNERPNAWHVRPGSIYYDTTNNKPWWSLTTQHGWISSTGLIETD